ncbi:MAG: T9SS type A sorting domain-containing protein, partial [Cyclobacteriaceae bacterium]|nr:T9SS type A sorting domain-containing protein [Cyclobacteriaceae bacterium]
VNPSMVPLSGVPFPYSAGSMPALPVELKGSWIESSYNAYANTGTVSSVKQQLDIAIRFKNERKVPVFCGEFGVHIPNSDPADRVFWYETVRTYLEANNIPWTIWDYHGGFGLFEKDSNGLFDHDLNISLLTALGLNTPPQTPYVKVPDSTGFLIYTDFLDQQLYEGSYGDGKIDFYSANQPNNGKNCISWTGASRYNNLGLYFRPVKDLSWLAANGYALDFMIRGDKPGFKFDVRFVDTKTGVAGDLPWRNRITIDETLVPMDGRWYHLHVPLSSFTEHGAWDQQWYEPVGEFDWREINLLELATEHADLGHGKLWFDNIHITNLDTAQVYMTDQITAVAEEKTEGRFEMYPNPVQGQLHIAGLPPGEFSCKISDGLGRVWVQKSFRDYLEVDVGGLPRGIYYVKVAGVGKVSGVMKLVKE